MVTKPKPRLRPVSRSVISRESSSQGRGSNVIIEVRLAKIGSGCVR
jgi:hypothetical protein